MLVNMNFGLTKMLLIDKDVKKDLLERATTIKRFEYSPLGKELKAQTDIAKKQYQKLDDTYRFDKIFFFVIFKILITIL